MGVVYEAFDRERGSTVALKTLTRVDAAGIYRLKQEFRSLVDVVHPNLVALYDLCSTGEDWFFTMELVRGTGFLDYVRGSKVVAPSLAPLREITSMLTQQSPGIGPQEAGSDLALATAGRLDLAAKPDLDRLRATLGQLTEAVQALHSAGKLHRDLKPTNVMVTPEGRLVVLDFGLVQSEPDPDVEGSLDGDLVIGTPGYMAPEQAAGGGATTASDWYAVGAMLHQALTGRLPIEGDVRRVLALKQSLDVVPPSYYSPGIPPDLDSLCADLLRRDPALRPGYGDIVARLRLGSVKVLSARPKPPRPAAKTQRKRPFFGRDLELRALQDALGDTRRGTAIMLYVMGPPGSGKTSLIEHFLEDLRKRGNAVLLTGQCYQRESVPYKAFDAVVDSLSRYLRRLPQVQADLLLPRNLRALLTLFPVLDRVESIHRAPRCGPFDAEESAVRPRAFAALKETLARIADRWPLVLHVDDLQWGDDDSAELLIDLLSPPDPPALLFIGSFRSDLWHEGAMLQRLLEAKTPQMAASRRHLELGPLAIDAAFGLALDLLDAYDDDSWALAKIVARAAGGNPWFIAEICRYLADLHPERDYPSIKAAARATVQEALGWRVGKLEPGVRRLLEVLAVAGAPVEQEVAAAVAGLSGEVRLEVEALRAQQLIRTSRRQSLDAVELAHGTLRDLLQRGLDAPTTQGLHRALALALKATSRAEPEAVARHALAGGELDLARDYSRRAGARAASALAFNRAAVLYEQALELTALDDPDRWQLLEKLAEVLARGGQSVDAARHLVAAARCAPLLESIRLTRQAAELQLRQSRVDGLFVSSPERYSLFDGIGQEQVQGLLADSHILTAPPGELLVGRSPAAQSFYVVLSGSVEIRREPGSGVRVQEGAVVGEVAFLLQSERQAEIYASSDEVRLLALNQHSFEMISESNPHLALQLVQNLSRVVCSKLVSVRQRIFDASTVSSP